MKHIVEHLGLIGIIPVVVIDDKEHAEPLARALVCGGVPCAEVTLRTSSAAAAIQKMATAHPNMVIGAGTVQAVDQVKTAVDAGAQFIVSPGVNRRVVEYCLQKSIPVIPGVATPTDIETALEYGVTVLKYFPAEQCGGIDFLQAVCAPYQDIQFIPTGGITEANLLSYLRYSHVLACGGSWMVKRELIAEGRFDEIQRLASRAVTTMLGFSLRHVGINHETPAESQQGSDVLTQLFGFPQRHTEGSIFVNEQFELTKRVLFGKHGHLAIETNFIDRALFYLGQKGVTIIPETNTIRQGKPQTVYLNIDLGGFAVHLIQP